MTPSRNSNSVPPGLFGDSKTTGQKMAEGQAGDAKPLFSGRVDVMKLTKSELRGCAALWHELAYAAEGGATDAELGRMVHDLHSANGRECDD